MISVEIINLMSNYPSKGFKRLNVLLMMSTLSISISCWHLSPTRVLEIFEMKAIKKRKPVAVIDSSSKIWPQASVTLFFVLYTMIF